MTASSSGKGDTPRPCNEAARRAGHVRAFGARCWHVNCPERSRCGLVSDPEYCTIYKGAMGEDLQA